MSKSQFPTADQGARAFKGEFRGGVYKWRQGATCTAAQSALTVILKLVMWWSDQRHLVLSTVSLQFQGQFPFP